MNSLLSHISRHPLSIRLGLIHPQPVLDSKPTVEIHPMVHDEPNTNSNSLVSCTMHGTVAKGREAKWVHNPRREWSH